MSILADPLTLAVLIVAVILLGMAKGGLAGVGALATPLAALVLPPATAAALLLPILIVQDVISVWSFRKTWDGWVIVRGGLRRAKLRRRHGLDLRKELDVLHAAMAE